MEFKPTHTIAGIQVVRKVSHTNFPQFFDAEGKQVHVGAGRPAIPLEGYIKPDYSKLAVSPKLDKESDAEAHARWAREWAEKDVSEVEESLRIEEAYPDPFEKPSGITLSATQLATCLRAATHPSIDCPNRYCEDANGDSAHMEGYTENGELNIRFCPRVGKQVMVVIPLTFAFSNYHEL